MQLPILYIGFSQALFAVVIILMKRPLKLADIILSALLMTFALMFGMNILQEYSILPANAWIFPLSISMTHAPLLFLYSKYVTQDFERFHLLDFLHIVPPLLVVMTFLVFRAFYADKGIPTEARFEKLIWIRNLFGFMFIALLVIYAVLAINIVIRFKKQIKHNYSFKSEKISLNWLLIVNISFLLVYIVIIINSNLIARNKLNDGFDIFRNGMQLFFVYIISIWGFKQTQLNSDFNIISSKNITLDKNDTPSGKYLNSGLDTRQAKIHSQNLIQFMEQTEAWKDNELSIAKLSAQTSIPKHHITQVLNENLGKNFYQFVNEYRIEYAKKLFTTPKYFSWSIVAIAYECGFNSKTAFNNFFKKYTGMTPSNFKTGNALS